MSITIHPPAPAGPDEPNPVSLLKDTAPLYVSAPPVVAEEYVPEPEEEAALSWVAGLKARLLQQFADGGAVRAHLQRAQTNTRSWLMAEQVTDADLVAAILAQRQHAHEAREKSLRHELSRVARQLAEHKLAEARRDAAMRSASGHHTEGHEHGRHRDSATDASLRRRQEELEVQLQEHGRAAHLLQLEPTASEIGRARWGRRTARAAALVGSVVGGGIYLPLQDPIWLLGALPAAAVALWRAGLPVDGEQPAEPGQPVPAASAAEGIPAQPGPVDGVVAFAESHVDQPVEGPSFAAAVTAAYLAAEEASSPGAAAARQVAQAAEQAAQVQGSSDLITALIKAKIIDKSEEPETSIVGVIRPDGPGWTATVELPGGKTAVQAISKATELASALKLKSGQMQLSQDHGEDGHEGRFTIWVANSKNPYAGAPVASELIGAESWDFWAQGVPLGTNARGIRKVLNMLWSSLLIGGLMGFGKSYLARLVAAAAVLDPYLKIVLLCGKSGADWAALKLVAHQYVSGNTTGTIREMHEVMEDTIAEMSEHGQRLEKLFETDPKACPEGKITPELARTDGLEMTLLLVDELQEILDAAAGMKLLSADEAEAALDPEGGRKPAGRNGKDVMVSLFARFMRVARYVGGMAVIVTQRPDGNSVPTELREVASKRGCYRVKGQNSSRMVLGDDAVAAGAAPHLLLDQHKGVVVLDEGAEEGHDTVRADVINLDDFREICERGRDLRLKVGTLTGQAAARWEKEREQVQKRRVIADAVAAMDRKGVDRARLVVLAEWMAEYSPERWHDLTETTLGARLRDANAGNTERIGSVDGLTKASGYTRERLVALLDSKAA
ncbi:hypothetical protein ABH930_006395 [Kitasatospora sp. GAS204A]|uniref:hypothetical protein n=1 Tax=unclassified Kitasatospora TaxID=2633591 RepID=UPI002476E018|nr:hypothetical protein [Kitasatospora sp. GAS204B]MDH6122013.1 hypothetical protein [Kitasatospora sp. GAS204B]